MAPTYKFTYFDFMGVGEGIRYMFAYSNVNYDNVVVNRKTMWPTMKTTIPFGKLPMLEYDGKFLYQPQTIARFLAKKFNLYTTDEFTMAQMDFMVESMFYFWDKVADWHRETDVTKKTYMKKFLDNDFFSTYLNYYEKMVETNGGFFMGKLSWVDFWFTGIMDSMFGMWGTDFLKGKYTNLYQLYTKVHTYPAIKTYVTKRPDYTF